MVSMGIYLKNVNINIKDVCNLKIYPANNFVDKISETINIYVKTLIVAIK
jgi:hypothetical protein